MYIDMEKNTRAGQNGKVDGIGSLGPYMVRTLGSFLQSLLTSTIEAHHASFIAHEE